MTTTDLCACGKPADHVNADPDVDEGTWACLVRNFDPVTGELLPPVGKYAPAVTSSAASGVTRADGEVERVMESIRHRTTIRHGDERIVEAVLRSLADYTLIGDAIKYGDGDDPAHRVCRLMHRLADGAR